MTISDGDSIVLDGVRGALLIARARLRVREDSIHLVVAVSGGEDSHVLLHACARLAATEPLRITVAHFDHALRTESASEGRFVRNLAIRYRLPFVSCRAGTRCPPGENLEAWARHARYRFLETVRSEQKAHLIATAHHENDQAETVLFRILTGRFPQEAIGMKQLDDDRHLLRPLLSVSKERIVDYAVRHRLAFVLDSSNEDTSRTRNRLRNELIPALARDYNPQIISSLVLHGERYEADERYIRERASCALAERRREGTFGVTLEWLNSLPDALALRILGQIAHDNLAPLPYGGDDEARPSLKESAADHLSLRDLHDVLRLVRDGRAETRRIDLGGGTRCAVGRELGVRFSDPTCQPLPSEEESAVDSVPPARLSIPGFIERRYPDGSEATIRAGIVVVKDNVRGNPERMIEWISKRERERQSLAHAVEYFDLEQLPTAELIIRERRDGDRVRVWNRGERKLKKLFLEKGVQLTHRNSVPIVESASKILWVPGVARSELAPVRMESRFLLELRYNKTTSS